MLFEAFSWYCYSYFVANVVRNFIDAIIFHWAHFSLKKLPLQAASNEYESLNSLLNSSFGHHQNGDFNIAHVGVRLYTFIHSLTFGVILGEAIRLLPFYQLTSSFFFLLFQCSWFPFVKLRNDGKFGLAKEVSTLEESHLGGRNNAFGSLALSWRWYTERLFLFSVIHDGMSSKAEKGVWRFQMTVIMWFPEFFGLLSCACGGVRNESFEYRVTPHVETEKLPAEMLVGVILGQH